MIQKFSIFLLFLFSLLMYSCYTITHPDPCPGLVEHDINFEEVHLSDLD